MLLEQLTALSHEFGTTDYVRGGGGNTSAKDAETLWVKSSGTTLSTITPQAFVAMNRSRLAELYDVKPPEDSTAREALVKDMMAAAVCPDSSGRPSVEAPLHDSFEARFVVHTHPALVNGMTCSVDGQNVCTKLFSEALWIDYTDPGFTLCITVRREIENYVQQHGRQPDAVFLQNHGLFVAGDTPEQIKSHYARILKTLKQAYRQTGVPMELQPSPVTSDDAFEPVGEILKSTMGTEAESICPSGPFDHEKQAIRWSGK